MTLQEFTTAVSVLSICIGAFWAIAKLLLTQSKNHIDEQFKTIVDTLRAQDDSSRRIERELLELKAELPRDYVRREDHNRVIGSLHVSLDNLRLTVERAVSKRGTP